jgi:membrane protein DedA with SNARE-associated domain
MTETILSLVEDWGIWGVLLSMFIEGSSFPFIGTFFIVTVGFILDLSWFEIGGISLLGSFLYAVGSYIPYFIGCKLGNSLGNRLSLAKKAGLEKVKANFSKYGIWSVAISSPLHLGNVVPFLAGMSNMNLRLYTLLTIMGMAPTTFLFLSIGHFYDGDTETIIETIADYQSLLLIGFVMITVGNVGWKVRSRHQKKKDAKSEMIG